MAPTSNAQRCKKYREKNPLHKIHYRLLMKLNDSEKYKEKKE